jgi:hypothetical protein
MDTNPLETLQASFAGMEKRVWTRYTPPTDTEPRAWLELKRDSPHGTLELSHVVLEWHPDKGLILVRHGNASAFVEQLPATSDDAFVRILNYWVSRKELVRDAADAEEIWNAVEDYDWPPKVTEEPTKKELSRVSFVDEQLGMYALELNPRTRFIIKMVVLEVLLATRNSE